MFAKPTTLTHPEAANLLLAGTTAAEMLSVVGAAPGETILLHGASGAVGVSVLQQAHLRGIRVIGTASEERFAEIRRFGGIPVRYGVGLLDRVRQAAGAPLSAALDAVGTDEAIDTSLELVADPDVSSRSLPSDVRPRPASLRSPAQCPPARRSAMRCAVS